MTSFTEANTVEQMILDTITTVKAAEPESLHETTPAYGKCLPARWHYLPAAELPRQLTDVIVEPWVREALITLNPEIASQPDRADEVIYNLCACILSVQTDGLVRANETIMAWLRGEKTMPFGPQGEHVSVHLVDTEHPTRNRFTVCNQFTYKAGPVEKRFDIVFLVNGIPLVIGEAKTPTRSAVTWFDGAYQVNEIYERQAPAMFVPNVFSFATEGRLFRYGSIRMPVDMWGPWRDGEHQDEGQLHHVRATVQSMLRPEVVLDIMHNFTLFATDKKHRRIKIICRYQQYYTTNQIVERVVRGYPKKGSSGISRGAAEFVQSSILSHIDIAPAQCYNLPVSFNQGANIMNTITPGITGKPQGLPADFIRRKEELSTTIRDLKDQLLHVDDVDTVTQKKIDGLKQSIESDNRKITQAGVMELVVVGTGIAVGVALAFLAPPLYACGAVAIGMFSRLPFSGKKADAERRIQENSVDIHQLELKINSRLWSGAQDKDKEILTQKLHSAEKELHTLDTQEQEARAMLLGLDGEQDGEKINVDNDDNFIYADGVKLRKNRVFRIQESPLRFAPGGQAESRMKK